MEESEFTKKCREARDALQEVIDLMDCDNAETEEAYLQIDGALGYLHMMSIPEGVFIGRSSLKCLIIEQEDSDHSLECPESSILWKADRIKAIFDIMGELGIARMNKGVYEGLDGIRITSGDDDMTDDELLETYRELFESELREIMPLRPDYFELGNPEMEIQCDESCRGTEKVLSVEQHGPGVSCTLTTRPDKCLYKDWL